MHDRILITKLSGERELFDPQKLRDSLTRAKARPEVIEQILAHIELELTDGMSTKHIYKHAFDLLSREERPVAVRYSLRNAIIEMGPTGFPFEKLIAEIFRAKGYKTTTDYIAKGACVEHEIDVVAWNENKLIMVEAKFHNEFGLKSDLKAALYVKARWEDLQSKEFEFGSKRKLDEGWLITNTKFSEQAIKYAKCQKMKLVGWNYPDPTDGGENLQDLISDSGLHPITSLSTISHHEKRALMEAGVILCKQAKENQDILKQVGISDTDIVRMIDEINLIQG